MDLYPVCAEELYSDVVIVLCNSSSISVLYGYVPLETGIARDSRFLGLSQRFRELGFRSQKFGSFQRGWLRTRPRLELAGLRDSAHQCVGAACRARW
jgi:hypothetical protein